MDKPINYKVCVARDVAWTKPINYKVCVARDVVWTSL